MSNGSKNAEASLTWKVVAPHSDHRYWGWRRQVVSQNQIFCNNDRTKSWNLQGSYFASTLYDRPVAAVLFSCAITVITIAPMYHIADSQCMFQKKKCSKPSSDKAPAKRIYGAQIRENRVFKRNTTRHLNWRWIRSKHEGRIEEMRQWKKKWRTDGESTREIWLPKKWRRLAHLYCSKTSWVTAHTHTFGFLKWNHWRTHWNWSNRCMEWVWL